MCPSLLGRSILGPISQKRSNKSRHLSLNNTALQQPKTHQGLFKDMKVYVYDLPSKYNSLFASEVAIHRALVNSDVRTLDPWEADFFFVPVYVSCNFSTINGFPVIGHARIMRQKKGTEDPDSFYRWDYSTINKWTSALQAANVLVESELRKNISYPCPDAIEKPSGEIAEGTGAENPSAAE
ncbi:hypothetical protein TEA_017844 [Camellia sinensis var. sinensis]|uniref:Exostosin GT47 domain-containing protein n=1 Tax=Camellia sinensis var. sinensis TaxID=542762 RepID=A0A4S4D8I5_CAMSN|nr:hypothetical protein TEA_017844 [Camellia sinensis var. sinensis]